MQRVGKLASDRKTILKNSPTAAELAFRELLRKYDIPHAFQKICFTKDMFYILDFTSYMNPRTIFEIDGSSHDLKQEYDQDREKAVLKTRTYKQFVFVRIANADVFNGKAERLLRERYPSHAKAA
jgi:very-short-patch-repair endonuclease